MSDSPHQPAPHCTPQTGGLRPLDAHLSCVGCGYDLFGLPGDARCPECGEPIAATLVPSPAAVWGLETAKTIRRGSTCLVLCHAILLPGAIVVALGISSGLGLVIALPVYAWLFGTLAGWWWVAAPPENPLRRHAGLCWIVRAAGVLYTALVGVVVTLIAFGVPTPSGRELWLVGLAAAAAGVARYTAGMLLIRVRLPDTPGSGRGECLAAVAAVVALPLLAAVAGLVPVCASVLVAVVPLAIFGATISALDNLHRAMSQPTRPPSTHRPLPAQDDEQETTRDAYPGA